MLSLDSSLFYIIAIIGILLFILNRIYFKPIRKIIDQRENKVSEESAQIEQMSLIVDEKNDWIDGKLKAARIQSTLMKEKLIRESEKAREKFIRETRLAAKKDFDNKMKQLEKTKIESEKELQLKVETFTRQIKEKLL